MVLTAVNPDLSRDRGVLSEGATERLGEANPVVELRRSVMSVQYSFDASAIETEGLAFWNPSELVPASSKAFLLLSAGCTVRIET